MTIMPSPHQLSVRSERYARCITALISALLGACTPTFHARPNGIGEDDAGAARGDGGLDHTPRGYAVVSSDYTSSMVSLLKADGTILQRDYIDSGSANAGLVTAFSGDIVLPTRSGDNGVLVIVDSYQTDVITRIDLASGTILGQIKTEAPVDQTHPSYSSNPHDYVFVDDATAWVSRYNPNPGAGPGDPDRGGDLLRIDPTHFMRSIERVDFSAWNGQAERKNLDTGKTELVTVYARPSQMVRIGDAIVVGIERLSLGYDAAGESLAALVDLKTKHVQVVSLPGLINCGEIAPVPDDPSHVAMICLGFLRAVPRETAGIAMLGIDHGVLALERAWHANDDPSSALTSYALLPLSNTQVLAMAAGAPAVLDGAGKVQTPESHDKLYHIDLTSGEQQEVFEADSRYVIGDGAYDPRTGLLLIPDASQDAHGRPTAGVRRFELKLDGSFAPTGITQLDAILPARQVRPFD